MPVRTDISAKQGIMQGDANFSLSDFGAFLIDQIQIYLSSA